MNIVISTKNKDKVIMDYEFMMTKALAGEILEISQGLLQVFLEDPKLKEILLAHPGWIDTPVIFQEPSGGRVLGVVIMAEDNNCSSAFLFVKIRPVKEGVDFILSEVN